LDPLREPGIAVLRFGESPPHLVLRVGKPARETDLPLAAGSIELAVGLVIDVHVHGIVPPCRAVRYGESPPPGMESRCRSRASRLVAQSRRYGSSHSSMARSGSGRSRYRRRWASERAVTRPASRSTRRCLETAGWLTSSTPTRSVTLRSDSRRRSRMERRCGSARTSKRAAMRANMPHKLYSCQGILGVFRDVHRLMDLTHLYRRDVEIQDAPGDRQRPVHVRAVDQVVRGQLLPGGHEWPIGGG